MEKKTLSCPQVIDFEDEFLRARRKKLFNNEAAEKLSENRFGIALSGGGIRSATINLGFLKTLNKFNILEQADYLSTVSGGGYTGAYIQGSLRQSGSYENLFSKKHIAYMRTRGEYLFPGTGWLKIWNQFILIIGYLISFLMSLISPAILVILISGIYLFVKDTIGFENVEGANPSIFTTRVNWLFENGTIALLVLFIVHYLFNIALNFNLTVSAWFTAMEAIVVGLSLGAITIFYFLSIKSATLPELGTLLPYIGFGFLLIILGMFTNPNSTSFHRFYRKQLSDTFLHFAGQYKNIALKDLAKIGEETPNGHVAPYPIVNTCLNLQSSKDPNFAGTKSSDYFQLSPLYCGAKLTGYVPTKDTIGYNTITLPAAVTISAAAVNPGMGLYSNRLLSILTTIFNLRLGYWIWNPKKLQTTYPVVWWPFYFFYELLSWIGLDNKMINISDGGHIENLGVMELLRRKCRLIVAIDAGADPGFNFGDLTNLTIRARNELGFDLRFRPDNTPETILRPFPSSGYSQKRFAIADIYQLWEKVDKNGVEEVTHFKDKKIGTFVYVKSTVTAPEGRPDLKPSDGLKFGTYKYKLYHPDFPHEPTSDQFFDPVQWESYFQLGQFIGADVLGLDRLDDHPGPCARVITIDELIDWFDHNSALFLPIPESEEIAVPQVRSRGGEELPQEEVIQKTVDYKM
ncbi:MAG: hypothetical protein DHS20C18_11230 [Saprospiraceae bacterium]|nr:MAG: hypothetical protein DHS20C18_11230 [Saprospiraceae bacterium]